MERKRMKCPETDHVELIDLERTPFGVLIEGCSRFLPRCAVDCSTACAARMDHHRRRSERVRVEGPETLSRVP